METDCFECYYCGECCSSTPCEYCDNILDLAEDAEIEAAVERGRLEYYRAYMEYLKETSGADSSLRFE